MTAVVLALGAAGYFINRASCSRFNYTVSWAWAGPGDIEAKQQRCEQAGCRAVEAGSYDDPKAIDEEYSIYHCIPK